MFRGSVKSTGYSLYSPVSSSLSFSCVTVCHHISTGLYCCLEVSTILEVSVTGQLVFVPYFLGTRANAELVTKIGVALRASNAAVHKIMFKIYTSTQPFRHEQNCA
jgi:hypothetical protein